VTATDLARAEHFSAALGLSLRGIRKAFGTVQAVDGLDLDVRAGSCLGLLGANGAGK